jgi:hypothetical protein
MLKPTRNGSFEAIRGTLQQECECPMAFCGGVLRRGAAGRFAAGAQRRHP